MIDLQKFSPYGGGKKAGMGVKMGLLKPSIDL